MTDTPIISLKTYGQTVKSLLYPIGVEESVVTPGILTVILHESGSGAERPTRYFSEAKASQFLRDLFILETVTGQAVVEGIEGERAMMSMLPLEARHDLVSEAQSRIQRLDEVLALLALGSSYYETLSSRVAQERTALQRLIEDAGREYVPEPTYSEAEVQAESARVLADLKTSVRKLEEDEK